MRQTLLAEQMCIYKDYVFQLCFGIQFRLNKIRPFLYVLSTKTSMLVKIRLICFDIKNMFVYLRTIIIEMEKVKKGYTVEQEQMARFAKALSHPIRIAILQLLASQVCCYHGDMSEILPVAKSTLSQHLKELKDAGLIQGKITLPSVKYCINKKNWPLVKKLFDSLLTEIEVSDSSCEI